MAAIQGANQRETKHWSMQMSEQLLNTKGFVAFMMAHNTPKEYLR
jgi:hypothetical protein